MYACPGVAAVIETVSVAVPVPAATSLTSTLDELVSVELFNSNVGPEGDTAMVRLTLPANPLRLPRVRLDVAEELVANVRDREDGLGVMLKSPKLTVTLTRTE